MQRIAGLIFAMMVMIPPAAADDTKAFTLDPALLFAVSGGLWEDSGPEAAEAGKDTAPAATEETLPASGYYRLIAIRANGGAAVYLQKIGRTAEGASLVESLPLEEINALSPLVIDIRPDGSETGAPGFGAFVHLKTDPGSAEPETWSVFVDEFGDLAVSRGTN